MPQAAAEQGLLKLSIAVTVAVAAVGVVFGLMSGSMSIVFDGVFSAIDAAAMPIHRPANHDAPKMTTR